MPAHHKWDLERSEIFLRRISLPDAYGTAARRVRQRLRSVIEWLERDFGPISEDEKSVKTWHLTLGTLAYDVARSAIESAESSSRRVARILNRSLLEYACRAHHYHRKPSQATSDIELAENMARKVMYPTRAFKGDMSDSQFAAFRAMMNAGDTDVPFPAVHIMMKNTLRNFGLKSGKIKQLMTWLDLEYTLGSALVHGSQMSIYDVIKPTGFDRNEVTQSFTQDAELMRTTNCLILFISAVEMHDNQDFGGRLSVDELQTLIDRKAKTTIWQHDALISLF